MKALLLTAILSTFAGSSAFADTAAEFAAQGKAAYDARDFSQAGNRSADTAAELYGKAAAAASSSTEKAQYLINQAQALYFVGDSTKDNKVKLVKFDLGVKVSDQALKLLGVADATKLTDADVAGLKGRDSGERALIAEALFSRGSNLGQWGQANGIGSSLGKWPELRRTAELIEALGHASIHDFGAYRILGRGYFKLPELPGLGDIKKAERYLSIAFNSTKAQAPNQMISRNGANNVYYAEVLAQSGKEALAKQILQSFIKADPAQLDPAGMVDLKHMQEEAKTVLKSL